MFSAKLYQIFNRYKSTFYNKKNRIVKNNVISLLLLDQLSHEWYIPHVSSSLYAAGGRRLSPMWD